jgi:hypothetical protein
MFLSTDFGFPYSIPYCSMSNAFKTSILFGYCAGGKIKKNEMGRACGTYGGGERCAQGFGGEARGIETIGETQT